MLLVRGTRRALTTHVTFAGDDNDQPGWTDFVRDEHLVALWDHDLLQLTALSPTPWCPTFTATVRHRDDVVAMFVGSYRGVRPQHAPSRVEPVLVDMRMPGQGHEPSWALRHDLTAAQRRDVMREFERGMIQSLGRHRLVGISYRNVTDEGMPDLRRTGAVTTRAQGQGTVMPLPPTFEEWLANLSKKRRKSLRRLAPMIEDQARVEFGNGRTDVDPQAVADLLVSMIERNAPLRVDPRPHMPAEYFRALMARDDVRTISYHVDDRLVAVGTLLEHPRHPWGSYWAMVHPRDGGVPHLYFDHFQRYAQHAIAAGAETLSSGRGFVDDKVSMGFEVTPLSFVGVTRPFLG